MMVSHTSITPAPRAHAPATPSCESEQARVPVDRMPALPRMSGCVCASCLRVVLARSHAKSQQARVPLASICAVWCWGLLVGRAAARCVEYV